MTKHPLCSVVLGAAFALLAGCGNDSTSNQNKDVQSSDATTTDTAAAADANAPGVDAAPFKVCTADNRAECLYKSPANYAITSQRIDGLKYKDILGADRNVNIAVYQPKNAPKPMPVVLLSHGGADGKVDPMKSMDDWAPVFAKAGYLAVAIAHEGREKPNYDAVCAALKTAEPCGIKISWDRPHDVDRVLQWLAEAAASGPLAGAIDLDHIAHVGHSAGAGAAMMSAGAPRNFKCALPFTYTKVGQNCQLADLVSLAKPEIDAIIALSPQGPGSEGFMNESFPAIAKPMLLGTGADDGDPGEPANRVAIFPLLKAGDKFKLWVEDPGAKHTLFEGTTQACVPISGEKKCNAMRDGIFATGLAFMDAYLRGDAQAKAWLGSDNIVTGGQGVFAFERK